MICYDPGDRDYKGEEYDRVEGSV